MNEVAPADDELQKMAACATKSETSDLETYICHRFEGRSGPEWLDAQQIDLASKGTEMLGIVLSTGANCNFHHVTELEWQVAGHIGFQYTSSGEVGVTRAFESLLQEFKASGKRGGPQKVFGRFYQWLQFNKNDKPTGLIRDVLREFTLGHFPIEAGSKLFGQDV